VTAPAPPLVVQVTPYYPPHLGGVELAAQIIAESLAATRRVEVLTSSCGSAGRPATERAGRLTVRRLRAVEIAHTPIAPALITALLWLRRDSVVHVHVAQAVTPEIVWITSKIRRRGYVAHFHLDVDQSGPAGRYLAFYKSLLLARVLRAAASVIVLSGEQADFVAGQYRVRRERICVVPNGVPPDLAGRIERSRPEAAPLRLLFVGRISPQKNLPRLIEALRRMEQPAELVVVGDGPELPEITRLVGRLRLGNVRLVGRTERSGLSAWYGWADVFVLSSDKEGMPLAALEAMSSGLPLVVTDVPGLRDLCSATGLVVPPDPLALARALDSLAVDPAARRRLAGQSLARSSGAGWQRSLDQIQELYLGVRR
jgi:glycosyltransferase involved in cell wall biosynthesis